MRFVQWDVIPATSNDNFMTSQHIKDNITHDTIKQLDHAHLWHPFTPMQLWLNDDPVVIVEATGHELIDDNGKHYLDGVSSLWCNVHGHNRPELNAAITDQLRRVAHTTLLGLTNVCLLYTSPSPRD